MTISQQAETGQGDSNPMSEGKCPICLGGGTSYADCPIHNPAVAGQLDEVLHTADVAYAKFGPDGAPHTRSLIARWRQALSPDHPDPEGNR